MNNELRLWVASLRIPDVLRRTSAQDVSASPSTAVGGYVHRTDGGAAAGDVLTKLAVVVLTSVNAITWEVYTESRVMAAVWAAIAVAFAVWMKRDAARR